MLDSHPVLSEENKNDQNDADAEEEMSFEEFLVHQARVGDLEEVQEMVDVRGPPVDVNYRDAKTSLCTALHMACANNHLRVAKLLLAQQGQDGAATINPNLQNDSGNTALHYACLNGHKDVVELLLAFKPVQSNTDQIDSSSE